MLNAAAGEETQELKQILKSGKIDVNDYLEKEDNETLLTKVIRKNLKPKIIRILLNSEADVNLCEKASGRSPFILACLNFNKNIEELILSRNPRWKITSEDADEKKDKDLI